jgi:PKD repeat protein
MSPQYRQPILLLLILSLLVTGVLAADDPVITLVPAETAFGIGESTTIAVVMDGVPTGLSGFNITVSLTDPPIGEITAVTYPAWAFMPENSDLPADSVYAQAVDLKSTVGAGAANVTLCTLTIRGDVAGQTDLAITASKIDDDIGGRYTPTFVSASITVGNSPTPTTRLSFSPLSAMVSPSGIAQYAVVITDVPTGLSGFNITVSLTESSIGEIVGISYPTWAAMPENSSIPADSVSAQAVDLTSSVGAGATNVTLCTLTVRGDAVGETNLTIVSTKIDDDVGGRYAPETTDAILCVENLPVLKANFTANVTSGTTPLTVHFTDTSVGTPTSWHWDFGDTTTSPKQNPVHTYAAPGKYNVRLTAANANGTDTIHRIHCITVFTPGELVAWGDNSYGKCNVPAGTDFRDISAGYDHSVALRSNGSIAVWGSNLQGQCAMPAGDGFTAIAAGGLHTVALRSDGSLVAWGSNSYGQCDAPAGNDFVAIAAGSYTNLALRSNGSLVAWGWDKYNQCAVPAGNDFAAIDAGAWHALALRNDGSLVAWGSNLYGQCTVPAGNDFVAIATGDYHNLALRSDGSLVAWGWNQNGQCTAPAGNDFTAIAAGSGHSLSLRSDGSIAAWGENTQGQCDDPPGSDYLTVAAGGYHTVACVLPRGPVTDFTSDVTAGVAPLTVHFTDTSTGNPMDRTWTFGDNATSTDQNPTHTYTAPGNYTVTLSINGGAETCTKTAYIKVTPVLYGDANDDNAVNQADTLRVLKEVVGLVHTPAADTEQFRKTDVHRNGAIDVGDALFIAQYNVGLRDVWFAVMG